ncbi:MAG: acetoacetate decarboxylase family protein [Lachnospiraceae bacterium]|nr:acetoacetate decarboxylase family protein [Lachnospiraceae bacterium]
MKFKYGFDQDPAVLKEFLKGGVRLTEEEGIWLTWESRPELVKAALPPVLDYVDPYVGVYIMRNGRSTAGPAFMEAGLTLTASYPGKVGMYAPAFLMYGPGAEAETITGREIYGISKKYAEDIAITKTGDRVTAHIVRGGRVIFECDCRLGAYNDEAAGMQVYGLPKKGDTEEGSAFFFTYEAHQKPDRDAEFTAVHLNDTVSITTHTEDWQPGSIELIDMEESVNDPWSYFEVVRYIGCGYAHEELHIINQIMHRNVGDPYENMTKLMCGKFDMSAFGLETRFLNTEFN